MLITSLVLDCVSQRVKVRLPGSRGEKRGLKKGERGFCSHALKQEESSSHVKSWGSLCLQPWLQAGAEEVGGG